MTNKLIYANIKVVEQKIEKSKRRTTAVWQNGGFGVKLNIWLSNEHYCKIESKYY